MSNARAAKASRIRRERLRAAGIPVMVDAARVRQHVESLIAVGVTMNAVAQRAGLSHQTLRLLVHGTSSQVRLDTAARLLAVTHHPHESQSWVPTVGALRRLRALQAIGWTSGKLGELLGMQQTHVVQLQHHTWMSRERWQQITDLYERLSVTPGPSSITRKRAAAKGWLNPFEWEGYDIDDPRVTPPRSARTAADRSGARADRLEQVAELTAQGLSAGAIADQLGVSERQIQRDRSAA
ncbi:hypothetical protein GS854_01650 [Rhodococcus hoagii]|nr:hypothetical protein [Prescottella equi]NKT91773.1 hypothetical protein [Prescottella equi]